MKYYWTLFSSDNESFWNRKPHVFAVFFSLNESGVKTQEFCISWLPEDGDFSIFESSKKGKNKTLSETLQWIPHKTLPVYVWGPSQIHYDFFRTALNQFEELQKGDIKYKVFDWWQPFCRNCSSALNGLKKKGKLFIGLKAGHEFAQKLWLFYNDNMVESEVRAPEFYHGELSQFKDWKKI